MSKKKDSILQPRTSYIFLFFFSFDFAAELLEQISGQANDA